MNKEHKIRNEEVERSWKSEVGSPKMAEASPVPHTIEGGQERAISNNRAVSIAPDISGQAVSFSQRNQEHDINKGLQPHILKMWLKPVSLFSISFCQPKQTACPDFSGAIEKENFNSFSKYSYQANRKLGLPADNFFNN